MKNVLSMKKSLKLLTNIVAWGAMVLWIIMLTIILSAPAKAQSIDTKPIVEYLDYDTYRVITPNNGYYHVNADGVANGTFKYVSVTDNVTIIARGQMVNGKKVGRVVYTVNGKKMLIRLYNLNGILTESTRINVSIDTKS